MRKKKKKKSAPEKQIRASDVIEVLRYRNMLKRHHGQKAGGFIFYFWREHGCDEVCENVGGPGAASSVRL